MSSGARDAAAALSVVLVTDHFSTIRHVVRRLAEQTARGVLEIVIVCPSNDALESEERAFDGFHSVTIVERPVYPLPDARAAGALAASGQLVFLGETHSYPHPTFAESLLAAGDGPWDVIVPGFDNANEDGPLSWVAFLIDYGLWLYHLPAGPVNAAPTWNVAYRRDSLLALGDGLRSALTNGDELATAFREQQRTMYFVPDARLDHANVSRTLWEWLDERYLSGLLVGSNRRSRWTVGRRFAYVLASPLIPLVILSRLARPVRAALRNRRLPRLTLPALLVGACARTIGEVVGYVAGAASSAERRMEEYEMHKRKYTVNAAP